MLIYHNNAGGNDTKVFENHWLKEYLFIYLFIHFIYLFVFLS